jgi:acetyl esterase/lipase
VTLDPQARAFLDLVEELGVPAFGEEPVEAARRRGDEAAAQLFGPVDDVPFEDRTLSGPEGAIPVRVYRPVATPAPVLVWFHGGGWVLGSLETAHGTCARIARLAGCVVVSVDYRLAPEHVFPAAVEDAWAATAWIAEHAAELGALPGALAVGGDSAGGNLAAVCALRARDRGLALGLQALVYPVLDADFERPSYREFAAGHYLTRGGMEWFWAQYLPTGDRFHPEASPLRAADLAGVAPAFVLVAGCDVLRDEGEEHAERLAAAGVPVALSRYEGQIHGFLRMPALIDRAEDALAELAGAVREAFAARPAA